jgi:ABC-type molybdate transport system substrate-binding protein
MRFLRPILICLACAIVTLTMLTPAQAADHTTLTVLVPSNVKSTFSEIIAAYGKAHPDITLQVTYIGSSTIAKEVASNASVDVVVTSELLLTPDFLRAIEHPRPLYNMHSVIGVSKAAEGGAHAVKIASPQDLAKPGVRLAMGTAGSGIAIWQQQNIDLLDKLYCSGYGAKVRANVQITKTDAAHLAAALDEGVVDAALIFASDIDAKITKIDLPPAQQITVTFLVAPIKRHNTPHGCGTSSPFSPAPKRRTPIAPTATA